MRWTKNRIRMLPLLAIGLAAGCSGDRTTPPADADMPNLLLITVDTLRADHLGCYGYERTTSPAIDALAKASTVFDSAYSPRALTWPALASVMTGLYPVSHGVRDNGHVMADEHVELAELFKREGYLTAAFITKNIQYQEWAGFDRVHVAEDAEVAQKSIEWLSSHSRRPFFLWVHLLAPHAPYEPPEPYRDQLVTDYDGPYTGDSLIGQAITLHQVELSPEEKEYLVSLYDAEIAYDDALIGNIIDRLDALGITDKTLVVFASDHGEDLYDHNRYLFHGPSVYDSSLRVPLMFRWPGVVPGGRRVPEIVELTDVAPTIVELLGLPTLVKAEGHSLTGTWTEGASSSGAAYSELFDEILTVRTPQYRYVLNPSGHEPRWISDHGIEYLFESDAYQEWVRQVTIDTEVIQPRYPIAAVELYDFNSDPPRRDPSSPEYRDTVEHLNGLLAEWRQEHAWNFFEGTDHEIDPETREALEALGYVFQDEDDE